MHRTKNHGGETVKRWIMEDLVLCYRSLNLAIQLACSRSIRRTTVLRQYNQRARGKQSFLSGWGGDQQWIMQGPCEHFGKKLGCFFNYRNKQGRVQNGFYGTQSLPKRERLLIRRLTNPRRKKEEAYTKMLIMKVQAMDRPGLCFWK